MTTTVWLFEPRLHGRRKEVARARNGASLPGRRPSSHLLHRSVSPALCPCLWARNIFSSSCVVVRAWCLEVDGAASGGGAMRVRAVRAVGGSF